MTTTAYVTNYAIKHGIIHVVEITDEEIEKGYFSFKFNNKKYYAFMYKNTSDWTADKEQALRKVNDMKRKKLISLERQIAKIESLEFKL